MRARPPQYRWEHETEIERSSEFASTTGPAHSTYGAGASAGRTLLKRRTGVGRIVVVSAVLVGTGAWALHHLASCLLI